MGDPLLRIVFGLVATIVIVIAIGAYRGASTQPDLPAWVTAE